MALKHFAKSAAILAAIWLTGAIPAHAQSITALVNGVPVTSVDIANRIKLLRLEHQPATANAALESVAADIIKLQEMKTYSVAVGGGDITQAIVDTAKRYKMNPEAFAQGLQRAGLTSAVLNDHWRAEAGFGFIVRSQNKMIEPSNAEVDAAIASRGQSEKQSIDYRLQQIVFALSRSASPAEVNRVAHDATALRAKFTSCETGLPMARTMPNAVLHDPITRNSTAMTPELLKILNSTPVGHLTAPERDFNGISVVAVCGKTTSKSQEALRTAVTSEIMAERLQKQIAASYAKLRSRATIERR